MDILPQLLVNAFITGSIYALASSGLSLTYALLRIINFAHGHLMMTGAYLFYFFSASLLLPLPVSLTFTIAASAVVGIAAMRTCVEPFQNLSPILPFVTTLSLATILEALVSLFFGVNVKSLSSDGAFYSYDYGEFVVTRTQLFIIGTAIAIMGASAFVMHSTPLGRKLRALSQNPSGAESIGVNRRAMHYGTFSLSVVLASIAGIMVGFETNIQPTMGSAFSIKASAAMILGGLGNIWGTIAGSYILGVAENLGIGLEFGGYSIPAGYKDAFSFIVILAILLARPEGLFSRSKRAV